MEKNLLIIGGGPGGYVAAIRAAQLGAKVTLIEERKLGGTCLNKGCIPTKALYKNAQVIHTIKDATNYGLEASFSAIDMHKVQERKERIVNQLVAGVAALLKANRVDVIYGQAKFLNGTTVLVEDFHGEKKVHTPTEIILATGSQSTKMSIPGIDFAGVLTSEELMDIKEVPTRLVIIGGGVIGIEFAGIFNALGTEVTVLEALPSILVQFDSDLVKRLTMTLRRKGIRIETSVLVEEIKRKEQGAIVCARGKNNELNIAADCILISTGRAPNMAGLDLDAAGISYTKKGIIVDGKYRTNLPWVYAIGDVIGGYLLAHVASEEGKSVADNIMGRPGHVNYDVIPSCVYTFPEMAIVGLTEDKVREQGIPYVVSKFMFGANGKALTMGEGEGLLKVIAHKETKELLGVHIMGPHASDLIHEGALTMENKLSASDIIKMVHAHPTLSECFQEAVMGLVEQSIHTVPGR